MKRHLEVTVLLFATFGCGAVQQGSVPAKPVIATISPAEYAKSGFAKGKDIDLAWHRASGCGLVRAPALTQYLTGVLQKLEGASPIRNAPAQVYVLATRDWGATTTADANIYVNLGLLAQLESEDEVAAVLAHELVHAVRNHADSDVVEDMQRRALLLSQVAFAVKDRVEKKQGSKPDSLVKQQWYGLQANTRILSPAWNRDQEQEADLLGVDLLAAAGYCVGAMRTVLEKQEQWEKQEESAATSTAASDPELDATINSLVRGGKSDDKASGDKSPDMQSVGISALKTIAHKTTEEMARTHPDTAERLRLVTDYSNQYYRDAQQRAVNVDGWKKARGVKETKAVFTNYTFAFDAVDKLRDSDLKTADNLARLGAGGATAHDSCPSYVLATVDTASGKRDEALKLLESTFKSPEPALLPYKEAAELKLQAGKTKEAIALLERAKGEFKEPPPFFPELIRAYRKVGRADDANVAMLRCIALYSRYEDVCRQANEEAVAAH